MQTRSVDRRNYPLFAIKLPPFKSMLRHLVSVSYCNCHLRYIDRGLGVYIKKKPFLLKAADYVLSSIYNGHKTSLKLLEIWQSNQLYIVHIPAVEIYTCIFLHVTEVFIKAMPSHTSHLHLCVNGRIVNFDLHVLANLTFQNLFSSFKCRLPELISRCLTIFPPLK